MMTMTYSIFSLLIICVPVLRVAMKSSDRTVSSLSFSVDCPSYSPDVNPIENLFSLGDDGVHRDQAISQSQTVEETMTRWRAAVKREEKRGAVRRMTQNYPDRLKDIIKARGGPTRY